MKKDTEEIKPKARANIHTTLLKWFKHQERGSVLDVPAGYGHLSFKLCEMGYEVTPGEIEPEKYSVPEMKFIYADLNREIDAPDNSFDYICCIDGLEHMTDPYQAVKEFSRILKPGGCGVFSIPNYTNIERRFKFLLRGYFVKPVTYRLFLNEGEKLYNFHNSPLTITILEFMLKINNLDIIEKRIQLISATESPKLW